MVERGRSKSHILYLNMELRDNQQYQDPAVIHGKIKSLPRDDKGTIVLMIDEVQMIRGWERLVNSLLAEGGVDLYITGSNSQLLAGELATLIAGRYVAFPVYTLGYREFLEFREGGGHTQQHFNEFLKFGGFPGLHHMDWQEESLYQYLEALLDSVVLKDVVSRYSLRNPELLMRLLTFLADNVGSLFSALSVAKYLKSQQRQLGVETVYNYLNQLESAFIFHRIPRFDLKGKRILETHEKFYLADLGLCHVLLGYRENKISAYLENLVCLELLRRGYKVMIGRLDDWEIDFVAEKQDQRIYIQVAYLLADPETWEREFRPLKAIADNYPKYVLSLDPLPPGQDEGIHRVSLVDFLLQD